MLLLHNPSTAHSDTGAKNTQEKRWSAIYRPEANQGHFNLQYIGQLTWRHPSRPSPTRRNSAQTLETGPPDLDAFVSQQIHLVPLVPVGRTRSDETEGDVHHDV